MTRLSNKNAVFENAIPKALLVSTFGFGIAVALIFTLRGNITFFSAFTALFGFIALTLAFSSMTVQVSDQNVSWNFKLSWIGSSLPLHKIKEVNVAERSWIYGYGWRWTMTGPLWRAWGYRVAALKRDDGKTTYLGSDDVEGLVSAINAAKQKRLAQLNEPHET